MFFPLPVHSIDIIDLVIDPLPLIIRSPALFGLLSVRCLVASR